MSAHPAGLRRPRTVMVGLLVSAIFLYLALRRVSLSEVVAQISQVSWRLLAASLLTKLAGFLFMTWRSKLLLGPVRAMSSGRLFRSLLLSFVGNNLLPLRLGEIVRVDYLARHGEFSRASAFGIVLVERLLDLTTLLLLFLCTIPLAVARVPVRGAPYVLMAGSTLALAAVFVIGRRPALVVSLCRRWSQFLGETASIQISRQIARFADGMSSLSSISATTMVVGLSIGYWLTSVSSIQLWLWACDISLPWYAPVIVLGMISFGVAVPSSPGYVGTYHYFAATALALFGVERATALTFAIVGHAVSVFPFLVIGVAVLALEWVWFGTRVRLYPAPAATGAEPAVEAGPPCATVPEQGARGFDERGVRA